MKKVYRMASILASILTFVLMCSMVGPASTAHATGYEAHVKWDEVQSEEPVLVYSDDPCLSPGNDYQYEGVYATLHPDDNSGDISANRVGGYDENGVWGYGYLQLPEVPLGIYEVTLTCRESDQQTVTMTYDPFMIEVVPNSAAYTVSDTQWLGDATVSSFIPCDAYADVQVTVFGMEFNPYTVPPTPQTEFAVNTTADATGHWNVTFSLLPAGAPNYFSYVGGKYFVRAHCLPSLTSSEVFYDSYSFRLTEPEYVALGDSYSSGTGSYNYDIVGGEDCFQSTDAYSFYVSDQMGYDDPVMGACHGAVTYDLLEEQLPLLSEKTGYVTLTIGGNDAGFSSIVDSCIVRLGGPDFGCSFDSAVGDPLEERLDALAGLRDIDVEGYAYVPDSIKPITPIKEVLSQIVEAAPNAQVYIAGYPRFFGTNTANYDGDFHANTAGYSCEVNNGGLSALEARVGYADATWLNAKAVQLNAIIEDAANEMLWVEDEPVFYVPVDGYSRFLSHGLCDTGTPWLNNVDLDSNVPPNPLPESFHPNVIGMTSGYGAAFKYWMSPRD